ncbi:hypothetical protein [Actinomadura graeca]|uniref:hypothetical protein n=1 Tax=Actinomadura graeca TaxID=2750812 RepID=UPI001E6355AF|nr:hypothetical protein [Actinomadura graeca]
MRAARRPALGALFGVLTAAALTVCPQASAKAAGPRIDLQVLVVTNGSASVTAVAEQLRTEGVPYKTVDLRQSNRPVINEAFLSDTVDGTPRAKYQAVVLPNAVPFENAAEATALAAYETKFGIRQLDAYAYPADNVGLNAPSFSGQLDGATATVSPAARADAFRYLKGSLKFDDINPTAQESYGFLATPLPDDPATGRSFQPYVTATIGNATGVAAGVYTHDGRSELVLTFSANSDQRQFRALGHGLITWLTKGVHLGHSRNYLGVHVDDVLLPDARWSVEDNCTPSEDCPSDVTTPPIRMTPDDVKYAADWQTRNRLVLDMAYNAFGSDDAIAKNGSDPLTDAYLEAKDRFRWLNHTYAHAFLGCVQNNTVKPWRCRVDEDTEEIEYVSEDVIKQEVTKNLAWASNHNITLDKSELVTGEHSGLRILPQQPDDNPNLTEGLSGTGVKWLAGDASRDKGQRAIGSLRTVPRHPLSVFFNVATQEEEVDEYNWIYTKRDDGGSGICEDNSNTVTCIDPLDPKTGFGSYIVPTDARITLSHVLANDPRPHYAHQSNLTEGRILYPVLERTLSDYRALFADNTPVISESMSVLGTELRRQELWRAALSGGAMDKGTLTAYIQDGKVTVRPPSGLDVPVTAPEGTREGSGSDPFGQGYAGERSAYKAGEFTLTPPGN